MLWVFKKIRDRLRTLLIADAALDLEAEFLDRHAERKAELLRKAKEFEEQGLEDLAEEVRLQAIKLSAERPLASVLPAMGHLAGDTHAPQTSNRESSSTKPKRITTQNGSTAKATQTQKGRKAKAR